MFADDSPEIAFYRAVEDLFSALRGVPHMLSPKDFQLIRSWWSDQIPLSAVRTGVTEVFARRRDRGEPEPVVSLSYCRHAVETHARRAAEMAVGAPESPGEEMGDTHGSVLRLVDLLAEKAEKVRVERPRVAAVIDRIGKETRAAADLERHLLEEHLYALETSLLIDCFGALDDEDQSRLEQRAAVEAEGISVNLEARDRMFGALRDRLLRNILDLPRMEIDD